MYSLTHSIIIKDDITKTDIIVDTDRDYPTWITITSSSEKTKDIELFLELRQARLLAKAINIICDNIEGEK